MRFVRYKYNSGSASYGWLFEDQIGAVEGNIFEEYRRLEADITPGRAQLTAPVVPSKVVCVGRNYAEHAQEHGVEVPEIPLLFLKPPSSIIGPQEKIILPTQSAQVEHEAELAVVIGRRTRSVTVEEATRCIFGYTAANDVTARDLQRKDGQWTRAKGFDTFCPIGPWIETELDTADILITCRVNEELRQMASTRDMVFSIPELISFASSIMTLEAGDVILTGTPAGVGPLLPGDQVEVTIDGIGTLSNLVVK